MPNVKQAAPYEVQLSKLAERGCIIENEGFCLEKLAEINYYRLTAYFLPFRQPDGRYITGTSFERVYRIYEFDRKLRSVIFSAIEEIEVFLRARLSYYHAMKYGSTGYLNSEIYSVRHNHEQFIEKIDREIKANNSVSFVQHHIGYYSGVFPIWVITELFTFGMLSYFYSDMKTPDKKALASSLYQTTPKNLSSWLRCCTDLRNICAHYGRLYYRVFSSIPAGIILPEAQKRQLWCNMQVIKLLYPNREKWNNAVMPALDALFSEYQKDIDLDHIAFPEYWRDILRK